MAERFNVLLKQRVRVINTGDSRFDRVVERALTADSDQLLPAEFMKQGRVIVLGSCWQPDEELVLPQLAALSREFADLRVLLVPHEPSNAALERLEGLLGRLSIKSRRLAELPLAADESMPRAIIIDRVGLLAGLYRGAWLAWVGGGLTTGVHSVIEPAAHGLPVLFGPRHHVAQEAQDLLKVGAAASFSQPEELSTFLRELLQKPDVHGKMATAASQLVQASRGASERIHACLFA
jgi:3-deoxy-D-manno-octulosonic-acid transferase